MAILPFYLQSIASDGDGDGLVFFRVIRLVRAFRIFKLGRTSNNLKIVIRVMKKTWNALRLLLFLIALVVVVLASVMYMLEAGTFDRKTGRYFRPDVVGFHEEETPFRSIPHSCWYVIVTMTTLGYGDLYPTTPGGRAVGIIVALLGILVLALPVSVIGAEFTTEFMAEEKERIKNTSAAQIRDFMLRATRGRLSAAFTKLKENSGVALHPTPRSRKKLSFYFSRAKATSDSGAVELRPGPQTSSSAATATAAAGQVSPHAVARAASNVMCLSDGEVLPEENRCASTVGGDGGGDGHGTALTLSKQPSEGDACMKTPPDLRLNSNFSCVSAVGDRLEDGVAATESSDPAANLEHLRVLEADIRDLHRCLARIEERVRVLSAQSREGAQQRQLLGQRSTWIESISPASVSF